MGKELHRLLSFYTLMKKIQELYNAIVDYLPLITFVILILVGIFLILKK